MDTVTDRARWYVVAEPVLASTLRRAAAGEHPEVLTLELALAAHEPTNAAVRLLELDAPPMKAPDPVPALESLEAAEGLARYAGYVADATATDDPHQRAELVRCAAAVYCALPTATQNAFAEKVLAAAVEQLAEMTGSR